MSGPLPTRLKCSRAAYSRSMTTSLAVPVEEYLRTPYHPDMEYVGGQLVKRHVGEYFHSRLQSLIVMMLGLREREGRFRIFTEQRVMVSDEPRYRTPDICVKALPHHIERILRQPDLVIEIVSQDDGVSEMLTKIGDYLAAGTPHVWVVDPYTRVLVEADGTGIRRPPRHILATPLVGDVDFASLFSQLDEPAE
jgi:Uma2 family endonuclease